MSADNTLQQGQTTLRYGELFAGYGGLGMGIQSVLGGEMAWCAEFDKAPSKILAHHWPDVPNLGDVTKVDWASVPKVDVITGGSPCQDLSHAGKRAGMKAGTRSGLWASMCDAIDIIRPRLVVWENVRGALSAEADSAVEPCPICVGDGGRVTLRALGRVLGDLAELGYDSWWYGLRAADVGAAHGRFRIFVFATPANAGSGRGFQAVEHDGRGAQAHDGAGVPDESDSDALRSGPLGVPGQLTLLKTPTSQLAIHGGSQHPDKRKGGGHGPTLADEVEHLLPTPRATRGGSASETRDLLLPTPRATDGTKGGPNQRGSSGDLMLPSAVNSLLPTPRTQNNENRQSEGYGGERGNFYGLIHGSQDWREYEAAIRRQEVAFGRPAPLPTEPGAKGQARLSPKFVEWLMAVPEGHVTDVPGISRNDMLKALGNGVCPPQAAAACRAFLRDAQEVAA